MGIFVRSLEALLSRRAVLALNLLSALLIALAIVLGFVHGLYNEVLFGTLPHFGGGHYGAYLQLKPLTLLLYSSLAFVLTLFLSLRHSLLQLSPGARLNLAVLLLVPEAIASYEFLNAYAFWIEQGFVQDAYFIFTTKLTGLLFFLFVGLQLVILKEA